MWFNFKAARTAISITKKTNMENIDLQNANIYLNAKLLLFDASISLETYSIAKFIPTDFSLDIA